MVEQPGRRTPNRLPADLRPLVLRTPRNGLSGELEIDAELGGVVVAADWKFDERSVEATTLLGLHADEPAAQTTHFEPPPGADVTERPLSPIPTRFKPAFAAAILTAPGREYVARPQPPPKPSQDLSSSAARW